MAKVEFTFAIFLRYTLPVSGNPIYTEKKTASNIRLEKIPR